MEYGQWNIRSLESALVSSRLWITGYSTTRAPEYGIELWRVKITRYSIRGIGFWGNIELFVWLEVFFCTEV